MMDTIWATTEAILTYQAEVQFRMSQCIISARDHGYPEIAPVALHELDPIIGSRTMLSLRNLLDIVRLELAPNLLWQPHGQSNS